MEAKDKRWIVQFDVGSAVIFSVRKTERYAIVIVLYLRDGTPDTKHFLDTPERAFEQAKDWTEQNIGPIRSIEEYEV